MNPGMPKGAAPKLYLGVHARLVFPDHRDEAAVLDLMRRFSGAVRFAYNRLLEGKDRKELKREDGPLCVLFRLNTRYADGAIEKTQAALDSAKELGRDPRKVVFGGRKLFEQLRRKHLSGKALLALKREWKERRQGSLYSRGDAAKKGNANLRLEPQVVALAEEQGVAIATERLKYLRKSRRGDGSGRSFRRKQHRFAYRALLEKIHSLTRKRGVEVLEVNPQDTSTIGMLKYAPQLHLSKDVAAAYVIGRRALGFEEKLPKGYEALLKNESFFAYTEGFYQNRLQELQKLKEAEKNPHLRRRLSREMGKAKAALTLASSLQGSPGSQKGSTNGRNPFGANPWRVLRVSLFLPLLGLEAPRDLSPLKPILHLALPTQESWKGWKVGLGPHPGGGPGRANVRFC
jgi:IS605 OrfB family transposase